MEAKKLRGFQKSLTMGLFAVLLIPAPDIEPHGKEWTGGGGLIENEFVMVWQRAEQWAIPCLSSSQACQLTEGQIQNLSVILNKESLRPLHFVSFQADSQLRVDQLGVRGVVASKAIPNSQVFVNLDVLYVDGPDPLRERGVRRPIEQLYAALLYQRGTPLQEAFTISGKVASFWALQQRTHHLGQYNHPALTASYFLGDQVLLFINDDQRMTDLSDWVAKRLPCEGGSDLPRLETINRTHWSSVAFTGHELVAELSGQMTYHCLGSVQKHWQADFNIKINFVEDEKKIDKFLLSLEGSKLSIFYREPSQ